MFAGDAKLIGGLSYQDFLKTSWSSVSLVDGSQKSGTRIMLDCREEERAHFVNCAAASFQCFIQDAFAYEALKRDIQNIENLDENHILRRFGMRIVGIPDVSNRGILFDLMPAEKMDVWAHGDYVVKRWDDVRGEVFAQELADIYKIEICGYNYFDEDTLRDMGLKSVVTQLVLKNKASRCPA